jgi:threonyl-tRNA synthetase
LQRAAERLHVEARMIPDEAAFYGPKIDVKLVDAIGRPWQLSTVQFDFTLPQKFQLEYIGEDGHKHQPLMVHRALYGSIERFFGILIEHYAGAFPVWLAPVQAIVLPITDRQTEYARGVRQQLDAAGIRATVDERNEKVNFKIREAQLQKIPYMLVVGDREQANGQVAVRNRKHGDQGAKPLENCIAEIRQLIDAKAVSE